MVGRAFEMWEQLENRSAEPLYVSTGALWLHRGDDAYVRSSAPVLEGAGFVVEQIAITEGIRRYPQIDFRGIESLWLERRAGVLSARRASSTRGMSVSTCGGCSGVGGTASCSTWLWITCVSGRSRMAGVMK
jgi:hypothetical protein